MKDKAKVEQIKSEASKAKSNLIELVDRLYAADAPKEAEQLAKIIIKLEVWQNK